MDSMTTAIIELAAKHNFEDWRIVGNELQVKGRCPICFGGKSGDRGTFSINVSTGGWNCKRGNCTGIDGHGLREGGFKQLCNFFGESANVGYSTPKVTAQDKKIYRKLDESILHPVTDEIVRYFQTRFISEQTMKDWKIAADKDGNIAFPFYRDEKLVFVKYRKPKRYVKGDGDKEWMEKDTEPILYGMDMTTFNKPLVITEGEFDCLALYEAGVTNVVSVPAGCTNMKWIDLCWEYLEKFNQIIIFGDSDEPGQQMVSTLTKRLGEDRCMIPDEYPEFVYQGQDKDRLCKDANEILLCYGPEVLKKLVDNCQPAPIKGVLNVGKIAYIDPLTKPRIMTRIPQLDRMSGGFQEGGVTILSGKAGEGKSTLTGSFLLNAIQDGFSTCVYSGELSNDMFLDWILLQACERKYVEYKTDTRNGLKNLPCVSAEIRKRIQSWLDGKMWLFDNEYIGEENQTKAIMGVFEACARRYGCKLFVVDNLMSALISPEEENKAQAKFTAQLKAFARKFRCHVLMVAHPRKSNGNKEFQNEDISGSSAIGNLADFVINVERTPARGVRLTKNRIFGDKGFINCDYDPATRRLYQHNTQGVVYGWDHTGIQIPENPAAILEEFKIEDGSEVPAI